METTFITIHELSPEARILYSSDSIVDVLGYSPEEVVNRSCWDYFHPEEVPFARARYDSGVRRDKAAMLSYCRMRDRDGFYLGCEIVFTIVYDCMVGCTSIYRRGIKSQNRAVEAPVIRRLFSTSPSDPRYHMLSHLSSKFQTPLAPSLHEPRAALFLNRYTRTLTIMYATNGLMDELGISGEELRGRSFYFCIQENCLGDSVRCLENAKANDSIAYLRFWFRDPRQDDEVARQRWRDDSMDFDSSAETTRSDRSRSEDTDMGGVKLEPSTPQPMSPSGIPALSTADSQAVSTDSSVEPNENFGTRLAAPHNIDSRTSSGDSIEPQNTTEHIFGEPAVDPSSESSVSDSPATGRRSVRGDQHSHTPPVELEAVVSCTSDGMVVCLRRARAPLPLAEMKQHEEQAQRNGVFAVPWATNPIMPQSYERTIYDPPATPGFSPPPAAPGAAPHVPANQDFMNSIRDIAVFAWALTGINGNLADYSSGQPRGESQPAQGLPIWQPNAADEQVNSLQLQDHSSSPQQRPHE